MAGRRNPPETELLLVSEARKDLGFPSGLAMVEEWVRRDWPLYQPGEPKSRRIRRVEFDRYLSEIQMKVPRDPKELRKAGIAYAIEMSRRRKEGNPVSPLHDS